MAHGIIAQQLYVAYFGRPADAEGFANFSAQLLQLLPDAESIVDFAVAYNAGNAGVQALLNNFSKSAESAALYNGTTAQFVQAVYQNVLNRDAEPDGLAFWVDAVDNRGLDMAQVALEIIAAAVRNGAGDAVTVANKTAVAQEFTAKLDTPAEVAAYAGDEAAAEARAMLNPVDASTNVDAYSAKVDLTIATLLADVGVNANNVFTLTQSTIDLTKTVTTVELGKTTNLTPVEVIKETYWGNGVDQGVPIAELTALITQYFSQKQEILELFDFTDDLAEIVNITVAGAADLVQDESDTDTVTVQGGDSSASVGNDGDATNVSDVTFVEVPEGDFTGNYTINVTLSDGTTLATQVVLTQQEYDFFTDVLFLDGNPLLGTRLFEVTTEIYPEIILTDEKGQPVLDADGNPIKYQIKEFTSGDTTTTEEVVVGVKNVPLVLTTTQNNGSTEEGGFTTPSDDLIVVGRLELLHGAYIDAGGGNNTLEIDAKGYFAQPKQLLNIQNISIENLPNVYTLNDQDNTNVYPDPIEESFALVSAGVFTDGDLDSPGSTAFTILSGDKTLSQGNAVLINGVEVKATQNGITGQQVAAAFVAYANLEDGEVLNVPGIEVSGEFAVPNGWTGAPVVSASGNQLILTNTVDGDVPSFVPGAQMTESRGAANSIIDLSRAVDLESLTITQGTYGELDGESGNLTVTGVRADATLTLEGSFSSSNVVTVVYGQGLASGNGLDLVLALGETEGATFNILNNSATVNLESAGGGNAIDASFDTGSLLNLNVSGDARLQISSELTDYFQENATAVINASLNTAGVELSINDFGSTVQFTGTQANDRLNANDNRKSVIANLGAGNNELSANDSVAVTVTAGEGNNEISATGADQSVAVTAGGGNNTVNADGSRAVNVALGSGKNEVNAKSMTAGDSSSVKSAVVVATDGDNLVNVTNATESSVTLGNGDNEVTASGADIAAVVLGDGNNEVVVADAVEKVTVSAGDGDNTVDISPVDTASEFVAAVTVGDGQNQVSVSGETIAVVAGNGSNEIVVANSEKVTIQAGNGGNTIEVAGDEITITTGTGNDNVTVTGTGIDYVSEASLLKVSLGAGVNSLTLGSDVGQDTSGLVAKVGSSIAGENITLTVENTSDLRAVDLSNADITKVVLNYDISVNINEAPVNYKLAPVLTLTDTQFAAIGAGNFEVIGGVFGTYSQIKLIITESTSLTALGVDNLARGVDLILEVQDGVELTMTARQLHERVAPEGVTRANDDFNSDNSPAQIIITGAGRNFDPFNNNDQVRSTVNGKEYFGGSLNIEDFTKDGAGADGEVQQGEWGSNVELRASLNGYNRPVDLVAFSSFTIDTAEQDGTVGPFSTFHTYLQIVGDEDLAFVPMPTTIVRGQIVPGGTSIGLGEDKGEPTNSFLVDFMSATGEISNLTLGNFENAQAVLGNGSSPTSNVRVNVEIGGNPDVNGPLNDAKVASATAGLISQGVQTYVVTKITNTDVDSDEPATAEFWTSRVTEDLQVLGLQGNYKDTIKFGNTDRNVDFLMEVKYDKFDGFAVGTLIADFARPGANAVVNVVNLNAEDMLALQETAKVAGIELTTASSATVTVVGGNTVIESLVGTTLTSLDLAADANLEITGSMPTSLNNINASAVDGNFEASVSGTSNFDFVGAAGETTLTLTGDVTFSAESAFTAAGELTLNIAGDADLSAANIAAVDTLSVEDSGTLTISIAQAVAIGEENIQGQQGATLNLVGLGEAAFTTAVFADELDVNQITIAAQDEVTLNAATDLSGVDELIVPEGTVLNLTAAQFQQLVGAGVIKGEGSVNITGLTQADIENGFSLAGVDVPVTVEVAGDVVFADTDTLGDASLVIGDGFSVSFSTFIQANGREISGVNSTVTLLFSELPPAIPAMPGMPAVPAVTSIDVSGYDISNLRILDLLVIDKNVDAVLQGLLETVNKVIFNEAVEFVDQTVTVEAGSVVRGDLAFSRTEGDLELQDFELNLQGGVEIQGDINLAATPKNAGLIQTYLDSVTINSVGTAANLITGSTANVITGSLTSADANEILNVAIAAEQDLEIAGDIVFAAINTSNATAALVVTGTADVTIGAANTADDDVDALRVSNNGTGLLTVGLDAAKLDSTDELSFEGTGDIALNTIGAIDLTDDVLTAVSSINIATASAVTVTANQIVAIGASNILGDGSVEITELSTQAIDSTLIAEGVEISVVTAAGTFTLNASTNLTNVDEFTIGEDSVVTMTAEQALQLVDATFAALDGSGLNITGVTQATLDAGLNNVLTDLGAVVTIGTIELVEDVELSAIQLNQATVAGGFTLIGTDVRVDVDMNVAQVGLNDAVGVKSTGISSYIVVDTTAANTTDYTFFVCNDTVGLETLGLQGNVDNTITFAGIKRGVSFLLEGDGVADWDELEKEQEFTDVSSIGTLVADFFTPNNPSATVEINNRGVALGEASDPDFNSGLRALTVDGVVINDTRDVTINVADGNVTIGSFAGSQAESLTVSNADGDVALWVQSEGVLEVIDATAVTGDFVLGVGELTGSLENGASFADFDGATVDLSATTLTGVDAIAIADGSEVTVSGDQAQAFNASFVTDGDIGANNTSTLNIVGFDNLFNAALLPADVVLDTVTTAVGNVVFAASVNLSGADLVVPEGSSVTMTAAQFNQLSGMVSAAGATVNIVGLTQADVDAGFDLSNVVGQVNLSLAEDVTFVGKVVELTTNLDNLLITLAGNTLTLASDDQADGLNVSGTGTSELRFGFESVADPIDASGYNVPVLKAVNLFFDAANNQNDIEVVLENLPSTTTLVIAAAEDLGFVSQIQRSVVVEEGAITPAGLIFNDVQNGQEISVLNIEMQGSAIIAGGIDLSTIVPVGLQARLFQQLNIESTGTAGTNRIDGLVTAGAEGTASENNLLGVSITGDEAFVLGGIEFSYKTGTLRDVNGAVLEATGAALNVNSSESVTIGSIDTTDDHVDALAVTNNGAGTLALTVNGNLVDATDDLSFVGTGDVALTIANLVDLSDDVLTAVSSITINDNAQLTVSQAQLNAVGVANFVAANVDTDAANNVLNIVGFGSALFDATTVDAGINVNAITMAAGSNTLNLATNLTNVDVINVPAGGELTLSAQQFAQLLGEGTINAAGAKVTITGLTQALVDAGFDLSMVTASDIVITLAESVNLPAENTGDVLGANPGMVEFILATDQILGLGDILQLSPRTVLQAQSVEGTGLTVSEVPGATGTAVELQFVNGVGANDSFDASGIAADNLRVLGDLIDNRNVELFQNLDGAVQVVVYESMEDLPGFLASVNRTVVIEEGVSVPGFVVFNDFQNDLEVRNLTLTMEGDAAINGDFNLSTVAKDPSLVSRGFNTLTINSDGTSANTIDGDITAQPVVNGTFTGNPTTENNLLSVVVNAAQDFNVSGSVVFSGITAANSTASFAVTGTADVSIKSFDTTDAEVTALNVSNNSTGTLNVTGGSPAIDGGSTLETVTLTGSGDMVFGNNPGSVIETGVEAAELSLIDASTMSGDLDLGEVIDVDSVDFTFLSGTGLTKLNLTSDILDADGSPSEPGWTFDFSTAAAGSQLRFGEVAWTDGALNVDLGANTTLFIDADTDFTNLDLSLVQTLPIVLADGVTLTLTAAQANGLNIIAGVDVGMNGFTGNIEIIDLADGVDYDFSGIAVSANAVLLDNDVTITNASDLGTISITLTDADVGLTGQTIRFSNEDQAARDIIVVGNNTSVDSTNVVWLFETITGPVNTDGYDQALGRLWINRGLADGANVEQLFTSLPSTIVRVEFTNPGEVDFALASVGVDRTVELVAFTSLPNGLVFSDADRLENVESLTIRLGGQVTLGGVEIDNLIEPSANPNELDPTNINFTTLTLTSERALSSDNVLAPELYNNNNNGLNEEGENVQPGLLNIVGNIGVGAADGLDLLNVVINTLALSVVGDQSEGAGSNIRVGTIEFDASAPNSLASLTVAGANSTTIAALDTSDADINQLAISNTGTGSLTVTGASPAAAVSNTEVLTIRAVGSVTLGTASDSTKPGIDGSELSSVIVFDDQPGVVNLGVIARVDSTNDGTNDAFALIGSGKSTTFATLGEASVNGMLVAPTLASGSNWVFQNATLNWSDAVAFAGGNIFFDNVAITINGDVDFTSLASLTLDNTDVTFNVPAGSSLTILASDLSGVTVTGAGVVNVEGVEDALSVDLSKVMTNEGDTGVVNALVDTADGSDLDLLPDTVVLNANANLGFAIVSVVGSGTLDITNVPVGNLQATVDRDATSAVNNQTVLVSFNVAAATTLVLTAAQGDERTVAGAGTSNVEDIGLFAGANDMNLSGVNSAIVNIAVDTPVVLNSDDNLGAAGAGRVTTINTGVTLTAAGSVVNAQFVTGENGTLIVDDENTLPIETPITANLANVSVEFIELVPTAIAGTITFPVLYGVPADKDLDPDVAVQTVTLTAAQANDQVITGANAGLEGEVIVNALGSVQTDLTGVDVGRATANVPADATLAAGTLLGEFSVELATGVDLVLTAAQADGRAIVEADPLAIGNETVVVTALELTPNADLSLIDLDEETALLNANGNVTLGADLGSNVEVVVSDSLAGGSNVVTFTGTMNSAETVFTIASNDIELVFDANDAHQLTVAEAVELIAVDQLNSKVTVNNVDGDLVDLVNITADTLIANVATDVTLNDGSKLGDFVVVLAEGVDLTMSFDQFKQVGLNDVLEAGDFTSVTGGVEETVTVTDFDPAFAINSALVLPDLALVLQLADAPALQTFNPASNLSGVEEIVIPMGVTLTMTADQFQQIQTSTTVSGAGTLNLVGFDNDNADIDLSSVTAQAGTISLDPAAGATTIVLGELTGTPVILDVNAVLDTATGDMFEIVLTADNQGITLSNETQADGRSVVEAAPGFINSRLIIGFDSPDASDADANLVATNYKVEEVFVVNTYLDNQFGGVTPGNIESFLTDLDSGIPVRVFDADQALVAEVVNPMAVAAVTRVVTIESNTRVDANIAFNDIRPDSEVRDITVNLLGNSVIDGNLTIPQDQDPRELLPNQFVQLFESLTISSTDAVGGLVSPNRINGNIIGNTALNGAESEVEVFTLTLDAAMLIAGSQDQIGFDGSVVNLNDGDDVDDVGMKLAAEQYANYYASYDMVTNVVTFTNILAGEVTDVTLADFEFVQNGSSTAFPGTSAVAVTQQGVFEGSENNLLLVNINATHELEISGTIEFSYVSGTLEIDGTPDETATAVLNVSGDADVTVGSVNTADDHITALVFNNTNTGTVTIPGTSPGAAMFDTESLTINNSTGALVFGTEGDLSKPGVAGEDLTLIDLNGGGTIDLGVIAVVNGDRFTLDTNDMTAGSIVNVEIRADISPTGIWLFENTLGQGDVTVTIGGTEVADSFPADVNYGTSLVAGGTFIFSNVTLDFEGNVDLTLADIVLINTVLNVSEGAVLTMTVEQVLALDSPVTGSGTVKVTGDATNVANLGMKLNVANIDLSDLIVDNNPGMLDNMTDADDVFTLTLNPVGATDDDGMPVGFNVIGTDASDSITDSVLADTITAGLGNDTVSLTVDSVTGFAGDEIDLGGELDDQIIVNGSLAAGQRVLASFVSAEVGDGDPDAADMLPAINLQLIEEAVGPGDITLDGIEFNYVGETTRVDDEGVSLSFNNGGEFSVVGIGNNGLDTATQNRGVFDEVVIGTMGDDDLDVGIPLSDISYYVNAGMGNDTIVTDGGNDFLVGGAGNDDLNAGAGSDTILAGGGNDTINGGESVQEDGSFDVLSGAAGEDVFVFDTLTSIPGVFTKVTDTEAVDAESVRLESAVLNGENDPQNTTLVTVQYRLNSVSAAINVVTLVTDDVADIAAKVSAALDGINGITSVVDVNNPFNILLKADNGGAVEVLQVIPANGNLVLGAIGEPAAIDYTNVAQVETVTLSFLNNTDIGEAAAGETYTITVALADGGSVVADYTAVGGESELVVAQALVDELEANDAGLNNFSIGLVTPGMGDDSVMFTITDLNADNGGFVVTANGAGAFAGSGASTSMLGLQFAVQTADVITDFVSTDDMLNFGLIDGDADSYDETDVAVDDFAAALAAAETFFGTGGTYFFAEVTNVDGVDANYVVAENGRAFEIVIDGETQLPVGIATTESAGAYGALFFDANGDGTADGVVELVGITANMIGATDIQGVVA